ncbi:UNVERIFIED_CONTAM: Fatty acid desaturase 4, chloroplastic [Sesamum latifolium]|uniref:Fatty acid desaturase 4, chloroplastic n=1 Tax=Sesamum latifolium TaxID=2727402 RepID=A0AAW2XFZ2_9LAMI
MAASLEKKNQSISSVDDHSKYKATWAERAWLASGCTTMLISDLPSQIHANTRGRSAHRSTDMAPPHYGGDTRLPCGGPQFRNLPLGHRQLRQSRNSHFRGHDCRFLPINLFSNDPIFLCFVGVFTVFGLFSLKFHAWSHLPRRKLPPVVAALQDAGVILRWSQHRAHHRPPFNSNYCVVSGNCDRVLLALEVAIFRVMGVKPRSWSEPISEWKLMMTQGEDPVLD